MATRDLAYRPLWRASDRHSSLASHRLAACRIESNLESVGADHPPSNDRSHNHFLPAYEQGLLCLSLIALIHKYRRMTLDQILKDKKGF